MRRAFARVPTWLVLLGAYGAGTIVAWRSSDVPEALTNAGGLLLIVAHGLARGSDAGRVFWLVIVPVAALVLFHERLHVRHWVAYGPAAITLALAWRADRDRT